MFALLTRINTLNNKPKKFENIYLITSNQKLLVFDMIRNTFYPLYLYARLERMAEIALNLYKGGLKQ